MAEECDYCGKEFGNAGAKASHELSCAQKNAASDQATAETAQPAQQQPQQPPQQGPGGPTEADDGYYPAEAVEQQQKQPQTENLPTQQGQPQQGAQPPATMDTEQAVGAGMQMGQLLAGAKSGDPSAQAEAKGNLMKAGAGVLASLGETVAERGQERHQRAKQHADRETKKSQDYPECIECGGQITQMPDEEPFPCPHCQTMLEFE